MPLPIRLTVVSKPAPTSSVALAVNSWAVSVAVGGQPAERMVVRSTGHAVDGSGPVVRRSAPRRPSTALR